MKETTTRTFVLSREDVRKAVIQFLLSETDLVGVEGSERAEVSWELKTQYELDQDGSMEIEFNGATIKVDV